MIDVGGLAQAHPRPPERFPLRRRRWTLEAVLFDRDGTLIEDVPYNGDPDLVVPVSGAHAALGRLRAAGIPMAVVTHQSGVGRGLMGAHQVDDVHRRIEAILGPVHGWFVCPHSPRSGCPCRKPAPGLVLAAAEALGVRPQGCVVVGDIAADVEAARRAGARGILVPNAATRHEEIREAPEVAADLEAVVDRLLEEIAS